MLSAIATTAGCIYNCSKSGTASTLVTSGIWKVASTCVFSTICAFPRFGFCGCTDPPSAMLLATRTGAIGIFTVSPACANTGS